MSTIIRFIITYVITLLLSLAIGLPIAYIEIRKLDKHISNKISTIRESGAARSQSLDEVSAQVDEIDKSLDRISESLDRTIESADRIIESTGLISEYLDIKIKSAEARENFYKSEFWNEKNIH